VILVGYAAPFAVFRDFTAGYFRSSFPFVPPSVLYGLLLNVAGIEMRAELGPGPTETKAGLPRFRVASAAVCARSCDHSFAGLTGERRMPGRAVLFQQLHTVPVGNSSKERIPATKGNKHHIAPARRELLTTLRGICGVQASAELEARIIEGLSQPSQTLMGEGERYGLPFLGDNNFFLEELALVEPRDENVDWLVLSLPSSSKGDDDDDDDDDDESPEDSFPFRLTIWADRTGMKGTRDAMFRKQPGSLRHPPEGAWIEVGPPS
jgi:CRISPR-associated protein Cas5t